MPPIPNSVLTEALALDGGVAHVGDREPARSATCANGEEIVGLHSGAYWPWPGARYCGGPKAAVFADFVQVN